MQPAKRLSRAHSKPETVAKAINEAQNRNNATLEGTSLTLLIFTVVARVQNVRFSDLEINEFKPPSERSTRLYVLMIISLYINGTGAKTTLIASFGLNYDRCTTVLNNLTQAGYIEPVQVNALKNNKGSHFRQKVEHLRLTSKGYDLANIVSGLLTDNRLI